MSVEFLDLRQVERILRNLFEQYDLDFEYEYKENSLRATSSIHLKGCDDHILAYFTFYKSGRASLDFIFDELELNENALTLVNKFNENVFWLKASLDEDGGLTVTAPITYITVDAVEEYVDRVMGDLADDDDMRDYLLPLTALTEMGLGNYDDDDDDVSK